MVPPYRHLFATFLTALAAAGCGQSGAPAQTAAVAQTPAKTPVSTTSASTPLPTASISSSSSNSVNKNAVMVPAPSEPAAAAAPVEGSSEWNLRKIAEIKATPVVDPDSLTPVSDEEIAKREREKQLKVIEMATAILAQTHADKEKEMVFNAAVHALSESRLELALAGDQKQIDSLYDDATSLFKRDPKSVAAATSAGALVKLAEKCAQKNPDDPRWLQEYVNQSNLFALSFPHESNRAVVGLMNAGKFCETRAAWDQAVSCYKTILEKYPNNPLSGQVVGMARRLSMTGQPLQFAGPTADGGDVNIDDFKGKQVLITFWKSTDESMPAVIAQVKQLMSSSNRPEFVWVCLDQDETAMDKYLEGTSLPGRQVFYSNAEQRGINNPLARYYGVQTTPTIWLVGKDGTVRNCHLSATKLIDDVRAANAATE